MTEKTKLQLDRLKSDLYNKEYQLERIEYELGNAYSYFDVNKLQELFAFNTQMVQYFSIKADIKTLKKNILEIELANRNGLEKIKDRLES